MAFAIVAAITLIPAVTPPLAVSIVGARIGAMNAWLVRHRRIVGAAVCFGFAIVLTVQGIEQLG